MKPLWVIEKDLYEEDTIDLLCSILNSKDINYKLVDDGYCSSLSRLVEGDNLIIPYGSIEFMKSLAYELQYAHLREYAMFAHGMFWCDFEALNWISYSSYWHEFLLNDKFGIVPYSVLRNNLEYYFDRFGREDSHSGKSMFIKPCANDKIFTGQVIYLDTAAHRLEYMGYSVPAEIPPDTLVVVAPPKKITWEWRSLISNKKVITTSFYKTNEAYSLTERNDDDNQEVKELLEKVAAHEWQPDSVYIADVARCGNQYKLLEIGSPNCAGWYKMDVEKLVDAFHLHVDEYLKSLEEKYEV